ELLESIVTAGPVALIVTPARLLMVMSPRSDVFTGAVRVSVIVVGPAARAGPVSNAAVAAESIRRCLYKSNLAQFRSCGFCSPRGPDSPAPVRLSPVIPRRLAIFLPKGIREPVPCDHNQFCLRDL